MTITGGPAIGLESDCHGDCHRVPPVTEFHLPRSTLLMLVSALMGLEAMQAAYAHAIGEGYRFYSYGDSSLLLPG